MGPADAHLVPRSRRAILPVLPRLPSSTSSLPANPGAVLVDRHDGSELRDVSLQRWPPPGGDFLSSADPFVGTAIRRHPRDSPDTHAQPGVKSRTPDRRQDTGGDWLGWFRRGHRELRLYQRRLQIPGAGVIGPHSGNGARPAVDLGGANAAVAVSPIPWICRTGKISYSLYLWHWPLITSGKSRQTSTGCRCSPGRLEVPFVGILLSWVAYVVVEQPLRSGIRAAGGAC